MELSEYITSTERLKRLTITGLKMGGHIVESRINDCQTTTEAAHACLREWHLSEQDSHIACSKLIEALNTVGLSNLVRIIK